MNSKRILSVSYSFVSGGSERLAASVTAYLHSKGETIFFCATHSKDGALKTEMESLDIPCYGLDFPHSNPNIFSKLVQPTIRFIKVFKLLKKLNINTLYIQHFPMLEAFSLPARILGIKTIIITEHTHYDISINPRLKNKTIKYAEQVSMTTVVHNKLLSYFKDDLSCKTDNFTVIENGVDQNLYLPKAKDQSFLKKIGVDADSLLMTCVARLHPDKDHENLLKALHLIHDKLKSNNVNWYLVLIGGGSQETNLKQLATKYGLSNNIIFLGDRSDVQNILHNFDLFILPSKTEGLPIVLLEAMACEIPCIATDVGGISELYVEGGGVVVPPRNHSALSKAILEFSLLNKTELKAIGVKGREIILSKYTTESMHSRYYDVIVNAK